MRTAGIMAGNILALGLFGVGLISPRTPSEGLPTLFDVLVFVFGPVAILFVCWLACRQRLAKVVTFVQPENAAKRPMLRSRDV